jgi:dienelactone hydrolase
VKSVRRYLTFAAFIIAQPVSADDKPPTSAAIRTEIKGEAFVGDFYCRDVSTTRPGILFLGGSEGGRPDMHLPQLFADHGYPVLAVAYFKEKDLPATLQMVPLKYFDKAIAWMQRNDKIPHNGIVIVGGSKGAELALLLASRKPEVKAVIARAPSSVVWDGMPKQWWPPDPKSSWSIDGKPVPFVPYDYTQPFAAGDPSAILKFYEQALKQKEAVANATIHVEDIHGPILLASGHDDQLWPSEAMGDSIVARLKAHGFKHPYEHLKYADAGHTLSEFFMLGGTLEGNRRASLDLTTKMLAFLSSVESAPK